jgi:hypothetical protein
MEKIDKHDDVGMTAAIYGALFYQDCTKEDLSRLEDIFKEEAAAKCDFWNDGLCLNGDRKVNNCDVGCCPHKTVALEKLSKLDKGV